MRLSSLAALLASASALAAPGSATSRAARLEAKGYFFSAYQERLAAARAGEPGALAAFGESALALGRFEPAAALAAQLRAKSPVSTWPASFRAAVAAREIRRGQLAAAGEYAPDVASATRIRNSAARSRALATVAVVRAASERLPEAIDALGASMNSATPNEVAMARVQRARLFYELGRFSDALEELLAVPKSSPQWYQGMNVAAWSAYRLRDDNLTLGQVMSLNSPHMAGKFNPESYILEAASLYRLCHYASAQHALKKLRDRYGKFGGPLARFRQNYASRPDTFRALRDTAAGKDVTLGGFNEREWKMVADGVFEHESVSEADRMLAQIEREENALAAAPALRSAYRQALDGARAEAYELAARAVPVRVAQMEQDLARNLEGALAVDVEINTRLRERLMTGAPARMREVDFDAEVRKGYEFWPFEGEYWRDELGGYTFATTDVCSSGREARAGGAR